MSYLPLRTLYKNSKGAEMEAGILTLRQENGDQEIKG